MASEWLSQYYEAFQSAREKQGTLAEAARLDFIREEVGRGHRVIELGCRFGSLTEVFLDGNEVVGADVDRRALQECGRRLGIPTHVVNLNDQLPFDDASFDVVVLSEVLEHLPYPEITLHQVARILRPGGKFVGSVPNAVMLRNRLRFLFRGIVELDPTHLQHFSRRSLELLLRRFFGQVAIRPATGRFEFLSRELFANLLMFSCSVPANDTDTQLTRTVRLQSE
jgi:SAM-dependent methyltransferase